MFAESPEKAGYRVTREIASSDRERVDGVAKDLNLNPLNYPPTVADSSASRVRK